MNFEFAEQINPFLEELNFKAAIEIGETALRKIPNTEFHEVIGTSLTGQADDLAEWVENFYNTASKTVDIKSLYFEMNEFDINTEMWYIDAFAFSKDGGLNPEDMDWLCEYEADAQTETETVYALEGYEKLQSSFENIELENEELQNARDWCEQIIIARFMELIRTAHTIANNKKMKWGEIPVYFTEHAYDFVVKSEN